MPAFYARGISSTWLLLYNTLSHFWNFVHIQNNSTPQNKKQWMRKSFYLNFSFTGFYVKCYRTWSFVVAATAAQMTSLKRVREIKRLLIFFYNHHREPNSIFHKKILSFLQTQQKNLSKLLSTRFIFIHSWAIKVPCSKMSNV